MNRLGGTGKIITYTTDSRETRTGILLPKNALKKLADSEARTLRDADSLQKYIGKGGTAFGSRMGVEIIASRDGFVLRVDAANQGNPIWRDPQLNRLAQDGHFTQLRGKMSAIFDGGYIPFVFEKLRGLGVELSAERPGSDDALRAASLSDGQNEAAKARIPHERDEKTGLSGISGRLLQAWDQARGDLQAEAKALGGKFRSMDTRSGEEKTIGPALDEAVLTRLASLPGRNNGTEALVFFRSESGLLFRVFEVSTDRKPYVLGYRMTPNGNVIFSNLAKGTEADLMDRVMIANALPGFRPEQVQGFTERPDGSRIVTTRSPEFADAATKAQVEQWFRDQGLPYIRASSHGANRAVMLASINGDFWLIDDLHEENFRVGPDRKEHPQNNIIICED